MGMIQHHAVIATTCCEESATEVERICTERGYGVVHTVSHANGYHTLFLPPDGGKEGLDYSDEGDNRRDEFIKLVDENFDWIEVEYGELGQGIARGNCGEEPEPHFIGTGSRALAG